MKVLLSLAAATLLAGSLPAFAEQPSTPPGPSVAGNTTYIDEQGTAYITRVVPVSPTLSPEAQKILAAQRPAPATGSPTVLAGQPAADADATPNVQAWNKLFPNQSKDGEIAGVPVRIFMPTGMPDANRDKVLINLHGGGFRVDGNSYAESIPIAGYTKMTVIAVHYRMLPKYAFPAPVEDVVAVYQELLKTHTPQHVVIYGSSAGAILTGEVAARLKQLGMPMPAAFGIFSGHGDFPRIGESRSLYSLAGYGPTTAHPTNPKPQPQDPDYVGTTDPRDPILSPIYGDLHGLPPTLFVTSGRDMLLSGTTSLHRAFLRAGVDAQLIVFDGLPHCFFINSRFPESLEATRMMAEYFVKELGK